MEELRPTSSQVFMAVLACYFCVTAGIAYDFINEPPAVGTQPDPKTGVGRRLAPKQQRHLCVHATMVASSLSTQNESEEYIPCIYIYMFVSVSQPPAEVCLTDLAWDYPGV